jgi:hypothetical protein
MTLYLGSKRYFAGWPRGAGARAKTSRLAAFSHAARSLASLALIAGVLGPIGAAKAEERNAIFFNYEVAVTNLTHGEFAQAGDICRTGQIMGLFAFATHKPNFRLFELGKPVSGELAILAESGLPFLLANALAADPKVEKAFSVPAAQDFPAKAFDGILCAGGTLKVTVKARPGHRLSMAAMVFPTNDAFIALDGVKLPLTDRPIEYLSPAYDAGSESNDELCRNIPGLPDLPGCPASRDENTDPSRPDPNTAGGPGIGEGYAHIHSGIHGIGDLPPNLWDWRNPVARITIRRVSRADPPGQPDR